MGGSQSKPSPKQDRPQPSKPKLLPCWRSMPWDDRNELRKELKKYSTGKSNIPVANIVLFGLPGAGKSSFFNTVDSIFKNKISSRSEAGAMAHNVTKKFRMYHPGKDDQKLKFRLCDTMGMEENQGLEVEDIPYILDGNIPDNFEFKPNVPITPDSKGFKPIPSFADRMHCICYLVDAKNVALISMDTLTKIAKLKALARARGHYIHDLSVQQKRDVSSILTSALEGASTKLGQVPNNKELEKESAGPTSSSVVDIPIDVVSPEVNKDTRKAYESSDLDEIVKEISKVSWTPISHIYLVKNYNQEQDLKDNIDVLTLRALKQILGYVDDVLQDMAGAANRPFQKVTCWREMPWDKRDALRNELKKYSTGKSNIPVANIVLFGLVGAGKSSFFNTVDSIFKNKISSRSEAGGMAHSVTKKFRMYHPGGDDQKLNFRLCDTMGMEENQGLEVEDMPYILDGNIPDNFEFKLDGNITPNSKDFESNPLPSDRMHCVCYVVDVMNASLRSKETLTKIAKLKALARARDIRFVILLTKIDQLSPEINKDTRKAYESAELDEIVKEISMVSGTPINYIYLVKNYNQEQDLNYNIDVLTLRALKQILGYVDDVLQDMAGEADEMVPCWREMPWEERKRNEVFTEVSRYSTGKKSVPLVNIVLLGSIGSGKSSFINTVDSIFRGNLSSRAEVRSTPDCVTKEFRMYRPGGRNTKLNFRLIDTMGMNEDKGLNLTALPLILDGSVPEKFKFSSGECLTSESPGLNIYQSLLDSRMHFVCYVMDANSIKVNKEAVVKMMKHIMSLASSRDIRVVVLLTKIDKFCSALTLDISKAYESKVLEEAVKEISSLSGLPENFIFLIKNFTTGQDLKTKADVLVLGALQQILRIVDDVLEDED